MGKKDIINIEIQQAEAERKLRIQQTANYKKNFINEIKTGLGDEMKKNPNGVKITNTKISIWKRIINGVKKIFTKF